MTRDELNELRENSKNDDQVVEVLFDKVNDLEKENEELKEYKWMYEELCK